MKAIADAKRSIEVELGNLQDKKRKIDADIYKLNMALESITKINGMVRINRQTYTKKCLMCTNEFKAKKSNAMYCSGKCNKTAHTKGVKLVAGAAK